MTFVDAVNSEPFILVEGAVVERLRRDPQAALDPHILHAGFVLDPEGRERLEEIYRSYLDVGERFNLPMIVLTPTWRANPERLVRAGYGIADDLNGAAVHFLRKIRRSYGEYAGRVFLGGLMGCRGDAYTPGEALTEDAATRFHGLQAESLAQAGTDFLLASTMPALSEAAGMARAMAAQKIPYSISFVLTREGKLLDGTALREAVAEIDRRAAPPPLFYMINCTHPTVVESGVASEVAADSSLHGRVIGVQGNASKRIPAGPEGLPSPDAGEEEVFSAATVRLHDSLGFRILGGCCGTSAKHIRSIAEQMTAKLRPGP